MISVSLSRGGNFTFGKTDRLCTKLIKEGGVSESFFNEVEKVAGRSRSSNVMEDGRMREELMRREVEEVRKRNKGLSEDEVHLRIASRKVARTERVLPWDFKEKNEKYEEALQILKKYYWLSNIEGNRGNFLVWYMRGMIYSHLQKYSGARKCFEIAKIVLDKAREQEWTKAMLSEGPYYLLQKKILKNQLKSELGKINKGSSGDDFLSGMCLVDPLFKDRFSSVNLKELFKGMRTCEFNELILECKILSMKEEGSRGSIFFTKGSEKDVNTAGYYQNRNTVYILPNGRDDDSVQDTMFHEITHEVLNKVDNNGSKPYGYEDVELVKEHHEAIRSVLWNIVEWVLPEYVMKSAMELEGLVRVFSGCYVNGFKGGKKNTMLKMEYVFDKHMPVEHLAQNVVFLCCYLQSKRSSISFYEEVSCEVERKMLEKLEKRRGGDRKLFRCVVERLRDVFVSYRPDARDVEFVTNLYGCLTLKPGFFSSEWYEIFKPYGEYLEKYVEPKLRKFIENNPERNSKEVEVGFARLESYEVVREYEEHVVRENKVIEELENILEKMVMEVRETVDKIKSVSEEISELERCGMEEVGEESVEDKKLENVVVELQEKVVLFIIVFMVIGGFNWIFNIRELE